MSCEWLTCLLIDQLLCISVVSADKHLSTNFLHCINCFSYTFINSFNCFDHCCFYTGMANHIRVCKINYDYVVLVRFDCIYKLVTCRSCRRSRG